MTSPSSDVWILLAPRMQPLLITLNHNANTILYTSNIAVLQHT
jgi:hypothetical protein